MDIKKEEKKEETEVQEQKSMLDILSKVTEEKKKGKRKGDPEHSNIKKIVSEKKVKLIQNSNWNQFLQNEKNEKNS